MSEQKKPLWYYMQKVRGGKHLEPLNSGNHAVAVGMPLAIALNYAEAKFMVQNEVYKDFKRVDPYWIEGVGRQHFGHNSIHGEGCVAEWGYKVVADVGVIPCTGKPNVDWLKKAPLVTEVLALPVAKAKVSKITTVEQLQKAVLEEEKPVVVFTSGPGFDLKKVDEEGYAVPSGQWNIGLTCLGGVEEKTDGLFFACHWGDVFSPPQHGEPLGGFWVRYKQINQMLRSDNEAYVIDEFEGFPSGDCGHCCV